MEHILMFMCALCSLGVNAVVCFRDDPEADPVEAENAGGRMAPNVAAAAAAAAERLHRAAELEVPHASHASQRHPSPPKRPFKSSSVPTLCALATHATLHLMTSERRSAAPVIVQAMSYCFVYTLMSFCVSQFPACSTAAVLQDSPQN